MPKGTDSCTRARTRDELERENAELRECIEAMEVEYEEVAAKLSAIHAISVS